LINIVTKSVCHTLAKTILFFAVILCTCIQVNAQQVQFLSHYKSSEQAEQATELFAAKLDSCHILSNVASVTNASKADIQLFSNYYADTISADMKAFSYLLGNTITSFADVEQFAKKLEAKYIALYQQLEQVKKEYPHTVEEYSKPQQHKPAGTCTPTCSDIGFESGTMQSWNGYYADNNSTPAKMTYTNVVGGALGAVTKGIYDIVNVKYHTKPTYQVAVMRGAGNDPIAGPIIPVVAPGGGSYSCRLGDTSVGGSRVAIIDQEFTVTAGNTAFNYMYAPVIDQPAYNAPHTFGQQPHFIVTITDVATGDTLQCGQYLVASSTAGTTYTSVYYKVPAYNWYDTIWVAPWKSVYVSLQNYIGHCIEIQAIVSDCFPTAIGPHFCYVYFDATCGPHSVVVSSPSVCGSNISLTAPTGGTYSWTGPCIVGSTTAQTISASCSGTYTVTVTSPDGCKDTLQKVVTITPTLSVTATSTNGGCTTKGTATANPTGGTPPYTYAWSNGNTNSKDTGLAAGNYTCTVTAAGCTKTVTVTITGGGSITTTIAPVNEKCHGGTNGSAVATPAGGSAPYTFKWNSGQTTSSLSNIGAGTYTCTVKDATGCTTTQTVTITQPTPIITSTDSTGTPCGGTTGTAGVSATGGTAPYTYSWSNGKTTSSITNLSGGVYTAIVTDHNGCDTTVHIVVPTTNGPRDSIVSSVNVLCFGGNNGDAIVGVKGGTPPYTYSWNTAPVQTTDTASKLTAGSYAVNITDNTGCIATATVNITQPPQLRDSINSVNVLCFGGNNGSATVDIKGGTPTYTYSWNTAPVQTTVTASNLTAGAYTVNVVDKNGCKDSSSVTITQPAALTLTGSAFPVTCFGQCNGSATVIPSGGTPTYTYSWTSGSSIGAATALCAGPYTVTVTDANSCAIDTSFTITQPTAIALTKSDVPAQCGQANGSATVTASGGTPGYTYSWSNGLTTSTITNIKAGTYCCTVTDANKCTDSICVVVPNISGVNVSITASANVTCFGGNNGSATALASGGTAPYTYAWAATPASGTNATVSNLTAGPYTVTVTDNNGCTDTAIVHIIQPTPVTVTSQGTTICPGKTATLTGIGSGGTPAYTYNWTPGGSGQSITVSPAATATYTVIATDNNNCASAPATIVVTVRPLPKVIAGPPASVCAGSSATIGAVGSSGDSIYTYLWSPGGATNSSIQVSPLVTTTYTVLLTDGCGDTSSSKVAITVLPPPTVNFVADTLNGCWPLCVKFTDKSTTTTGTITSWAWTFGDGGTSVAQDTTYCYNNPGVYTVSLSVKGSDGCSASETIPNYITVYSHPVANFTYAPQPANIMQPTIYFTDQSTDAYGIANWFWQFGDGSDSSGLIKDPQHTYADTGWYCVNLQVTNLHGCTADTEKCLYIEPFFAIYVPNAFTPNGDGLNELFTAKAVGIKKYEMWIFDRWGMQLYHCTDINNGWNGKVQNGASGAMCQEDTYVWLIVVEDVFDKSHRYVGRVSIIK